jgi:hypothetical protein
MITSKIFMPLPLAAAFLLSAMATPGNPLAGLPPYTGGKPISADWELSVPYLAPPDYWDRYIIQVWQYQTEARRDLDQYRSVGLHAFHIDRGWKQDELVDFARENDLPYYVDHAADKGLLHLTEKTGVNGILKKHELVARPVSLSDPAVIATLKGHLEKNVGTTKAGPVLAYSFDDEISLASFNSPSEVDNSPATVSLYREWLVAKYENDISQLNRAWGSQHADFSTAGPISFEEVRLMHRKPPFSQWRLAPWMDWRSFMDTHFAEMLAGLTRYTNALDPRIPAGFVGAQQPSAYGGYDYNKLGHAVQFLEAYDIDGTNEILRSFWSWPEQRPRVQTWFSNGNANLDRWFHWYYLLHGNRGAIAWPDTSGHGPWFGEGREPAPFLVKNREVLEEIQGDLSRTLFGGNARFETDAVAVFYSMPSIRVSWVADVVPHGKTWPNRSSSLDNQAQAAGKNRIAWFKLLEDCGYQYNVVSNDQVAAGALLREGYRVLILNRALAISDQEAESIRAFVRAGGTVVADHWCGLVDENGNGRSVGALDDLFGIERAESDRYFGGDDQIWELNGERYQQPYLERLDYEGTERHEGIVMPERGRGVRLEQTRGGGRCVYLNLSPLAYFDHSHRFGAAGEAWRTIVKDILIRAEVRPDVTAIAKSGGEPFIPVEVLRWDLHNGRQLVGIVMNPSRQGSIDSIGEVGTTGSTVLDLELTRRGGWKNAVNKRSGETYPAGDVISLRWDPFDAIIIECDRD